MQNENLLVGIETSDDAAIYKVNDTLALVQTLDFFTPVVDDPYHFGQIAAANSLSDVYAMGADPVICMNIACFPKTLDPHIIGEILRGGYDKVIEAGAVLAGGHTVDDKEPKYGLSVTGFVHPQKFIANKGAKEGDVLILTKPLGTGIINTAIKGGLASPSETEEAIRIMSELNRGAKEAMVTVGANACTDITGFGLLGHVMEMAGGAQVTMRIFSKRLPMIAAALNYAAMGIIPEGAYANLAHVQCGTFFEEGLAQEMIDLACDPQTSGGLLIATPKENAEALLALMEQKHVSAACIGEVVKKEEAYIHYLNQ